MPLGKGVKYRAKRLDKTHYIRLGIKNGKVVEATLKRYKKR